MDKPAWQKIQDSVYMFQDSCRVYAVQCPEGTVIINAGTGLVANHLGEVVQNGPVTVLLTHHFRDHTDGSIRLHAAGAKILGPYFTAPLPLQVRIGSYAFCSSAKAAK